MEGRLGIWFRSLESTYGLKYEIKQWLDDDDGLHEENLRARILEQMEQEYSEKEELVGAEDLRVYEKGLMLQILDTKWKEHLADMDYLRQGIHLRGYAQKNPKQEYKREAFEMFSRMLEDIKQEFVSVLTLIQVRTDSDMEAYQQEQSLDVL